MREPTAFHFYPRSPCGERHKRCKFDRNNRNFYPRSPCGERQTVSEEDMMLEEHFYPRSPCGERRVRYDNYNLHCTISIHALLAESDRCLRCCAISCMTISIHALLAESDPEGPAKLPKLIRFLSTLSLRRATVSGINRAVNIIFLSTLSLRRATLFALLRDLLHDYFYPRSPCGERRLTERRH